MTVSLTAEQAKALLAQLNSGRGHEMVAILATAVAAADLYLNSYDTSAPSRIKAETRAAIEEAMAYLSPAPPSDLQAALNGAYGDVIRNAATRKRAGRRQPTLTRCPEHDPAYCSQCAEDQYR